MIYLTRIKEYSEVTHYAENQGGKHIAVLAGGMSAEREVSLSSAKGVIKSLLKQGYQVSVVDMGQDFASVIYNIKPDIVFNCLHGTFGEDGCVPGVLNIMQIPYTHTGLAASAICFDKNLTRKMLKNSGILMAKAQTIDKNNLPIKDLKRPYVIKPIDQGSSIGIEIIDENSENSIFTYDFAYGDKVTVEEYIKARELQVAVLNGKALGVLEIKLLKKKFYDYETKYTDGFAEHIMPAQIKPEIYEEALRLAELANEELGCKGLCRAEFLYEETSGKIYFLEINTHPGLTPLSICPEIAAHAGISFDELVEALLEDASFDHCSSQVKKAQGSQALQNSLDVNNSI